MISIIVLLFVLAAICNACMDKLSFHYHKSIFNKLNPNFWNPAVSWRTAKIIPFTKYKLDAWHLFKSAWVVFVSIALATAFVYSKNNTCNSWLLISIVIFLGIIWNTTFNLFFNRILSRNV